MQELRRLPDRSLHKLKLELCRSFDAQQLRGQRLVALATYNEVQEVELVLLERAAAGSIREVAA